MKKLGIAVLVLLGIYGCWQVKYPSGTFRYKLTLVVDDNGKMIISSSVRQVTVHDAPKFPESHPSIRVKGEAVVVDLNKKGVLFVLMHSKNDSDYGYRIAFAAFPDMGGTTTEGIRNYSKVRGKRELTFDDLPMLVRFRDINDPKTVEKVDPNNLAESFGEGVKLVSATIEITDEPVTKGIEEYLPWIREYYTKLLDGNTIMTGNAKNRLANDLGSGSFSIGMGLSPYGR